MKGWRAAAVALMAFAIAAPPPTSAEDPPHVPCVDPRGCPDLATDYPSLLVGTQRTETFAPNACPVREGSVAPGARQLVRLSFTFGNVGPGDVELGAPTQHPGWYEWSLCHGHYHLRDHATFRVWTVEGFQAWDEYRTASPERTAEEVLAAHPELASAFVAGKKQGFCVVSGEPMRPGPNGSPSTVDWPAEHLEVFGGEACGTNQGQDVGWADTYDFDMDGMWVDVTDVPTGTYVLEGEMNASHFITETNYANNRASVPLVVVAAL